MATPKMEPVSWAYKTDVLGRRRRVSWDEDVGFTIGDVTGEEAKRLFALLVGMSTASEDTPRSPNPTKGSSSDLKPPARVMKPAPMPTKPEQEARPEPETVQSSSNTEPRDAVEQPESPPKTKQKQDLGAAPSVIAEAVQPAPVPQRQPANPFSGVFGNSSDAETVQRIAQHAPPHNVPQENVDAINRTLADHEEKTGAVQGSLNGGLPPENVLNSMHIRTLVDHFVSNGITEKAALVEACVGVADKAKSLRTKPDPRVSVETCLASMPVS